ncbi:hypothetical protein B0I35DRAFT_432711 [Stachybotrys elegans]|uniref:Uncharacterized protein n=1 Tax=Stachybotrys elegans TaxID=80388 RepID=A0A8K0WS38_9HYPO|nr:hypothetical protein B0I35DRAFT_432711 [Stachybotrys elegans]
MPLPESAILPQPRSRKRSTVQPNNGTPNSSSYQGANPIPSQGEGVSGDDVRQTPPGGADYILSYTTRGREGGAGEPFTDA